MNKLLATVLFTALSLNLFSQKSPIKFGDIPMEDLTMTTYAQDSSAAAVILADYGTAFISVTGISTSLVFDRHIRIKILKKEGLKWADASIPLYFSGETEESISNLKAMTYNLENNKVIETKLSKDGVFKEKFNSNVKLQKFTLPNVKEGSVIEYSYRVNSGFISNFPNWQFQYEIPVRHTEYWAFIPEYFIMEKYMQGYVSPTTFEIKDKNNTGGYIDKAHHWIIQNVPAFKVEPFMTCEDDYITKINFALAFVNIPGQLSQEFMGSWKKLNDELLASTAFGKTISGSVFLKKQVDGLIAAETDPLKKVEIIYNYVKSNLGWTGYNDFASDKLKEVFEAKKGTTGDINLALASMLDKAGFEVDMVLLSTRDHGFVRQQYPMSKQFNYVVCLVRIDNKPILLDATEKFLPLGVLPERCLNGQGLVISKKNHGWINLETKTKAKTVISGDFTLTTDNELNGKIAFSRDGYDACEMRKDYLDKGETEYLKNAIGNMSSWDVSKSSFENLEEIQKMAVENHELVISEHIVSAGDVLYINPFVVGQIKENPFTLTTRTYPVDYGSMKEKVYMFKITLPEGYVVDEMPQSKMLSLPGGTARYTYSVSQLGNTINVISNFQINKNIFAQTEYPNLREFYNQVVAKQAEQIVLKKK